jgi:Zn-finger nucleic acid-binding protein
LPPLEPLPLNREKLRRQITCPKCGWRFETYPHSGPGNVVLDGCTACDLIWLDFGEMRQIVEAPGRDRGSRDIHPVDDEYVRHGPSATHDHDSARSRETDPPSVLADLLFG